MHPSFGPASRVFIGTYTKETSQGIYTAPFDANTGQLGEPRLVATVTSPSFLALSPDRRHLYAVSESGDGKFNGQPSGSVSAFAVDPSTGNLRPINSVPSGGRSPCHLSVTPDGHAVLVSNYHAGTVALLPIRADGGLEAPAAINTHSGKSVHPTRQQKPFAHSINPSPDGRFAYAADLGTDHVYSYTLDTQQRALRPATACAFPPGSGPRHLATSPDGRRAYVINELLNTLTVLTIESATGDLNAQQTLSTLPAGFSGESTTAEVAVHPSGRFVYGSNRGHDSIAVFAVSPSDGQLSLVEHTSTQGRTPRHFAVDPTGRWLIAANQNSHSLVVFAIDPNTGRLTSVSHTASVNMPVCVRFF